MASAVSLEILIKAFVEGLQNVEALNTTMDATKASTEGVADASGVAGDSIADFIEGLKGSASQLNEVADGMAALEKATQRVAAALSGGEVDTALKDTGDAAKDTTKDVSVMGQEIVKLGDSAKKVVPPLDTVGKQLSEVAKQAKVAAIALLAYLGITSIKQIADEAAADERLALALEVVGRNAGYAASQLKEYSESLQSIGFSSAVADKALTKLITTGIDLTRVNKEGVSSAVELGTLAKNLAVTTGQSEASALEALTQAISRGNERAFKQLNLRIDLKRAEQEYADQLGITVGELTKADKAQAAFNAATVEGTKFAGLYKEELNTTSGQLKVLATEQERLSSSIGKALLPSYLAIVQILNKVVVMVQEVTKELFGSGDAANDVAATIRKFGELALSTFKAMLSALKPVIGGFFFLIEVLGNVYSVIAPVIVQFYELIEASGLVKITMIAFAATITAVGDILIVLGGVAAGVFGAIALILGKIFQSFPAFFVAINNAGQKLVDLGDKMLESASKTGEALDKNHAALLRLTGGAEKAKVALDEVKTDAFLDLEKEIQATAQAIRTMPVAEAAAALQAYKDRIAELPATTEEAAKKIRELSATVDNLTKNIYEKFSLAKESLKLTPGELSKGYKDEGEVIGRALATMATDARETGTTISNAFRIKAENAASVQDLGEIFKALTNDITLARLSQEEFKSALDAVGKKFFESFDISLAASKTVQDVQRMQQAFEEMSTVLGLTDEQMAVFGEKIVRRTAELKLSVTDPALVEAFKVLGTTAEEATNSTTAGATKAADALTILATSGKLAGDALQNSLGKGLDLSKTLADVAKFKTGIDAAATAGKLGGRELTNAYEQVRVKTDALFDSLLKSVNTKGGFEQLRAQVQKLGADGVISYVSMSLKLEELTEKQNGFRAAMVRSAAAAAESASATTKALSAQIDVARQSSKIQQGQTELVKLEKAAREDNTAATRAGVTAQKALIDAEKATLQVKKDQAALELATIELISAKQAEANAKDALERDKGNEALQLAVSEATKLVEQKQIAVSNSQTLLELDKQQADALAFAAEEAKRLADNLKDAAEAADKSIKKYGESIGAIGFSAEMINEQVTSIAGNTEAARRTAQTLAEQWMSVNKAFANKEGIQALFQILDAQAKMADEIKRQAEELKHAAEEAARWKSAMDSIFDSAESAATAITDGQEAVKKAYRGTVEWADAMASVANRAAAAAKGAREATLSFLGQVQDIRVQLLRAQGKEVEATKLEFEAKRKQLAIEERLLEIKIRAAIIQAKAAGLDDAARELEGFLGQVKDGYAQALKDIDALEAIQIKAAQEAEKAAREAEEQKRKEQKQTHSEKIDQLKEQKNAQSAPGAGAFFPPATGSEVSQSIANGALGGTASAAGASAGVAGASILPGQSFGPSGLIQVDFTFGGKSVKGFVEKSTQQEFLDLIDQAKKSAA